MRASAGLTAQQARLVTRLQVLQVAGAATGNWRGVVALAGEALALAQELRVADPGLAGQMHGALGLGFAGVGDYGRAIPLHEQHKTICEELGDRVGLAATCGNLGNCYESTGEYARAITLRAVEEDRRGDGGPRGGGSDVRNPRGLLQQHGGLCAGDRAA